MVALRLDHAQGLDVARLVVCVKVSIIIGLRMRERDVTPSDAGSIPIKLIKKCKKCFES